MKGSDIDSLVGDINEYEERESGSSEAEEGTVTRNVIRTLVGTVDRFFDRVGVAAIVLNGRIRVGDTIEIVDGEERVRQRVDSMQIDRKDVSEANAGDDVGIKTDVPVRAGGTVYIVEED
jgi:translation initiation factor IF-2